jgi:hypothetical protein
MTFYRNIDGTVVNPTQTITLLGRVMDLNTQALLNGVSITANFLGYVSRF